MHCAATSQNGVVGRPQLRGALKARRGGKNEDPVTVACCVSYFFFYTIVLIIISHEYCFLLFISLKQK